MSAGATPQDWQTFINLDLTADLLPVVSDTSLPISPRSRMKDAGKTPSVVNTDGHIVGLSKWTEQQTKAAQVKAWAKDGRLGICVQTRAVRAIDVDIADPAISAEVRGLVEMLAGPLPCRSRSNSGKLLLAFRMAGTFPKQRIKTDSGVIEFLANGQQFVAVGTHPSGVRYEWDGLDFGIPSLTADEFAAIWQGLALTYGAEPVESIERVATSNDTQVTGLTEDDVKAMLAVLDPAMGYDDWLKVGQAIHHESRGEWLHLWIEWSQGAEYPGDDVLEYKWSGFGRNSGAAVTAGTLIHMSREATGGAGVALSINAPASPDEFPVVAVDPAEANRVRRKGIPEAKHLTTDQANAGRIVSKFGKRLIVVAGQWYAWTGMRWEKDDGEVYRYACRLSQIIHAEGDTWRAKKAHSAEETEKNNAIADALAKWAQRSEMKATIEAAVSLAKKMLAVDEDQIDRNPWLLNCVNGTVDLRTGALGPHNPEDFITKLAPLEYDPAVHSPVWESVVARVTLEEGMTTRPMANFLQRWFGYCATGSTREQSFVVHYGQGSNGKSTILDTVAEVLGDYAATAAPGLLVGHGADRHPTEIADLFGRRMVTAHETGEGGQLKEDTVKQLTGSDKVKARFMRADFFEFDPTHKLQLLTNHKPIIKGQDNGIWRRVLLMPYLARWASAEDVKAGRAHFVKDTRIAEQLKAEIQGVLTWVVEGARQWFQDGLQPPDAVLAASRDYQAEQDRVGQFISECCELGQQHEALLAGDFGGLYETYRGWCGEGGFHALSKIRLVQELERCVPGFKRVSKKQQTGGGKRRDVVVLVGLRVLET